MSDFYEVDFLKTNSDRSGDAIAIRYRIGTTTTVHIVDGGFQETGEDVVQHVRQYYGTNYVDRVIVTHPDGDHAGGLRSVLEELEVSELWMLRPWLYAGEIIDRFSRFTSVENLERRLKEIYPNIAALEEIAEQSGIPIYEPFQGTQLGEFAVLAPSKVRYLGLIVESERTPESTRPEQQRAPTLLGSLMERAAIQTISFLRALWGKESFSSEETSSENEMSLIQYANLCGQNIILTGDAGRSGLSEAAAYASVAGLNLPGVDRIQVPHHGSRRNVSTAILDYWLGGRLPAKPEDGSETFTAVVSAAKNDSDHPRKAVVRAFIHRGGKVFTTEDKGLQTGYNAPDRAGWSPATPAVYPEEQEE